MKEQEQEQTERIVNQQWINLLLGIRLSVQDGYLPPEWHDTKKDVILLNGGKYALKDDCVNVDGIYMHSEKDRSDYEYDEINDVYIDSENAVTAYGRRGSQFVTNEEDCIYYGGNYYVLEYIWDNDIVCLHNGHYCNSDDARWVESEGEYYYSDDVYYWESDGEYHLECEPDDEYEEEEEEEEPQRNNRNKIYDYDGGIKEKDFRYSDVSDCVHKFGFGMEIEKAKLPNFDFDKEELYERTGAVIERDGSVSDGFELKTPIYNLFSDKTIERLEELKPYSNIKSVEGAGGHIGFSMDGKNDIELLDMCSGWIPLIYAMYKKRLTNTYCQAKTNKRLKNDNEKNQSIRLRGNYIEFRIIASVKSHVSVLFRLNFFRILANNLNISFTSVIGMAINSKKELCKLLTGDIYEDNEKFKRLIQDAITINAEFGNRKLTQKSLNKINKNLLKLKTLKTTNNNELCALQS